MNQFNVNYFLAPLTVLEDDEVCVNGESLVEVNNVVRVEFVLFRFAFLASALPLHLELARVFLLALKSRDF